MHSTDVFAEPLAGDCPGGAPPRSARRDCLTALLCVTTVLGAVSSQAGAQRTLRARLDNDAYTFWMHPAQRTDEEYSNGVKLSTETYHAPWWAKRFASADVSCEMKAGATTTCVSHDLAIGQDIYTPNLLRAPFTVDDWELERPYAAWLYLTSTARFARPRSLDEVELNVGVTGQPALGELAQTIAHTINQRYTNEAHGWETQVGFEPGLVARYRRTWLLRVAAPRGVGVEVQPFVGAAAGNILTNAEGGMQLRVGFAMSHPWHLPSWSERAPMEFFLLGGVRQEFVARNISLDGNTVDPARSVARVPAVGEHSLGFGVRLGRVSLAWRAVIRGREYESGPKHHSYGIMQGAVDFIP